MPTLSQRVDRATITVALLPLPKGKKRGRGIGFWGGDPVASIDSGNSAAPFRWRALTPQIVPYEDVKKLQPSGTSATQLAGSWYTPKHDERALVWTRTGEESFEGVELHPKGWEKSATSACGDGQQVGYGYVKFAKDPKKALLWSGSRESMIVLAGPDPSFDATAHGVSEGIQVGGSGASIRLHACLWRGSSESYLDLHPSTNEIVGSEAYGVGDGQQVGHAWGEEGRQMAALWSGSAESFVNLAPDGFVRSTAWRCARGFQVGWATQKDRGMSAHAILWGGAADDFIDLQLALPEPWNVSQAMHVDVDGDTLRVVGTAQQAVQSGNYEMDAGSRPVVWEMKLLVNEPPARRESVIVQPSAAAPAELSDERKVERLASDLAQALIAGDYDAAHALLAPWLQRQVTPARLQSIVKKEFLADLPPVDFAVSANDSTLDELRDHYAEYHENDASRTLATAESFGEWGPPSIHIADEVTAANFRQWLSIDLTPEEDNEFGLDFILRLWLIAVDAGGEMRIGHLEPGE